MEIFPKYLLINFTDTALFYLVFQGLNENIQELIPLSQHNIW
ncbi:hypothetical protein X975_10578, partial [Stegodyphus mimosarum]